MASSLTLTAKRCPGEVYAVPSGSMSSFKKHSLLFFPLFFPFLLPDVVATISAGKQTQPSRTHLLTAWYRSTIVLAVQIKRNEVARRSAPLEETAFYGGTRLRKP